MIDCSPGAGSRAPEVRLARIEQKRDNLISKNKVLKDQLAELEEENDRLKSENALLESEIREKDAQYSEMTKILQTLESQEDHLISEHQHLQESSARYQQLATKCSTVVQVEDLQKEVGAVRDEIIKMEKEILDLQKRGSLNRKLEGMKIQRADLIQENVQLVQDLNELVIQLTELLDDEDNELLSASEALIEKQLESEELRKELVDLIQIRTRSASPVPRSPTITSRATREKQQKLMKLNDELKSLYEKTGNFIELTDSAHRKHYCEISRLKASIKVTKDRRETLLNRDKQIDDIFYAKARKEATLEGQTFELDTARRGRQVVIDQKTDLEETNNMLTVLIEQMKSGTEIDTGAVFGQVKEAKAKYRQTHETLKNAQIELERVNGESSKLVYVNARQRVGSLREEIRILESTKAELKNKQEQYKMAASERGAQVNANLQRQISKLESEINSVSYKSMQQREQKKRLNQSIEYSLSQLSSHGLSKPKQ